ncbi:MAG: hypothetical protein ISQ42_04670 [Flavobacteriaceae bacterium]|nr:hypothetical protein [Flavobacteriaceae bacterium]
MKLDERSALPDDVVFPILSPDVDEDDYYDVIKEKRNTLNRTLGRLGKEDSKVKPFGKLSLLGFSVLQDNSGGDIEFLGSGIGIGLGSDFFISSQLAINLGYTIGAITIDEVSIGNFSEKVEESASSGRFNLGLVYYF